MVTNEFRIFFIFAAGYTLHAIVSNEGNGKSSL